jgi:hypothetical protein
MKPVLFLVGLGMVLYLISPYLGGGKVGILWDIALLGAAIPKLNYNAVWTYNTLVMIYAFLTLIVLAIGIFGQSAKQKAKKAKK